MSYKNFGGQWFVYLGIWLDNGVRPKWKRYRRSFNMATLRKKGRNYTAQCSQLHIPPFNFFFLFGLLGLKYSLLDVITP